MKKHRELPWAFLFLVMAVINFCQWDDKSPWISMAIDYACWILFVISIARWMDSMIQEKHHDNIQPR